MLRVLSLHDLFVDKSDHCFFNKICHLVSLNPLWPANSSISEPWRSNLLSQVQSQNDTHIHPTIISKGKLQHYKKKYIYKKKIPGKSPRQGLLNEMRNSDSSTTLLFLPPMI